MLNPASKELQRMAYVLLGVLIFCCIYYSPPWPCAIDPGGTKFILSHQGKAALGLFALALVWWIFEVVPIGVTSIAIAMVQVLFLIRPDIKTLDKGTLAGTVQAFGDFFHPSVWFIFASLVIGMTFTKTGLTKRFSYKMLSLVGERTSMIYLGCFVVTALLTHIMAHTAVAATMFPLLCAIHGLYHDGEQPTRFGKGLFIGMAFVAGAGSIITLLGSARAAVAIGFFKGITGAEITFFELTMYMFPVGWLMVFVIWLFCIVVFKPEKKTITGLKQRSRQLYAGLGKITGKEIASLVIVISVVVIMALRSFIPALSLFDKSAILLVAPFLFFVFRILDTKDLEEIPWNIILLFGGAMSLGYCMVNTGAADWLAVLTVTAFKSAPPLVFILGVTLFILVMTNVIMNVAAIAICLPVALKIAPYLNVGGEVILFSALVAAGMPFLFLIGAAPNAIAYESRQFTSREFFMAGLPVSLILLAVVALFVIIIWPLMGMPVFIK